MRIETHDQMYQPVEINTEDAMAIMDRYDANVAGIKSGEMDPHWYNVHQSALMDRAAELINELLNQIPSKELHRGEDHAGSGSQADGRG